MQVVSVGVVDALPFTDWNSGDLSLFFQEANVGSEQQDEFYSRCERFCTCGEDGEKSVTLSNWLNFNMQYKLTKKDHAERVFRAMDRAAVGRVSLAELFAGCVAANPGTPHILNSHTGFQRARYFFDYYDEDKTGFLNFDEVCSMVADTMLTIDDEEKDDVHDSGVLGSALLFAQEFGELSVVTLWIDRVVDCEGLSERMCELRVSREWTVRRICKEVAYCLDTSIQGLGLALSGKPLQQADVLGSFVGAGDGPVALTVTEARRQEPFVLHEKLWSSELLGLEKFVHVSFQSVRQAISTEKLRGTSRLFRFQRVSYHPRSRSCDHMKNIDSAVRTSARCAAAGA